MKSTIDSAGRLVLPKSVREAINLHGGTEVEIRIVGDHVELSPVPAEVSFVQEGSFVVAVPDKVYDKRLTVEEVEETRKEIDHERMRNTDSQ